MMRIFKSRRFSDFADKESISDMSLKRAAQALEEGRVDADLGGGVFKQRLARPGGGKSGGYRLIICFRKGVLTFFIYGFPKSERENITTVELRNVKRLAKILLNLTDEQLNAELTAGGFVEIKED
jgi:hypothetical protein